MDKARIRNKQTHALPDMELLDEERKQRYPGEGAAFAGMEKSTEAFRNYDAEERVSVKEFYRLNHHAQTFDFVQRKKAQYLPLQQRRMSIWEAMEFLNTLVDDSDPDADFSQIEHLMQTSEAIRADGHPRWFILTGLLHDLGKVLCLYGEPQWAVVGRFPDSTPAAERGRVFMRDVNAHVDRRELMR